MVSKPAGTPETEAEDLIVNCDGDTKEALKFVEKMKEQILDQVHAVQGFEAYKEHKKVVQNEV